jgi:LDH2 family malate/lactate/ureidoglycolate dehydrogenase
VESGFAAITQPLLNHDHFLMTTYWEEPQPGQADFIAGLADLLGTVRTAKPAAQSQPVLAPGDPQRIHERERRLHGIPLDARTADLLSTLATNLGVPGPSVAVGKDEEIAS